MSILSIFLGVLWRLPSCYHLVVKTNKVFVHEYGSIVLLCPSLGSNDFFQFCESTVRINIVSSSRQDHPVSGALFFTQHAYTFTAPGCTIGSSVGQIKAQPSVDGSSVTYSIANGNPFYAINPQTGLIFISNSVPPGTQSITAIAQTGSRKSISVSAPVTINANCELSGKQANGNVADGGPISLFSQSSYQFTTSTCTAGGPVGQIFSQAFGDTVLYVITPANSQYAINPQTGQISAKGPSAPGTSTQTFTVNAISSGGQTGSVPVTITRICPISGPIATPSSQQADSAVGNGGGPVNFFRPSYQFTTSACTSGSVVGAVSAQFFGNGLQYSIQGGNAFFSVNLVTGQISVSTPPPAGTWSQSFTVVATTPTGQTATAPVTVTTICQGNGPPEPTPPAPTNSPLPQPQPVPQPQPSGPTGFSQPSYFFTLQGCTAGASAGNVLIVGLGSNAIYSLSPAGNPYFAINPNTGQITTLQGPPIGPQSFNVQAVLSNGQSFTVPVTVNTIDTGPSFPASYNFFQSSCAAGSLIGQAIATSCGPSVSYTILGSNPFYTINQNNGQITSLTTPPTGAQRFVIQATSLNGQAATAQVIINSSCKPGSGNGGGENGNGMGNGSVNTNSGGGNAGNGYGVVNVNAAYPSYNYPSAPLMYSNRLASPLVNQYLNSLNMMHVYKSSPYMYPTG